MATEWTIGTLKEHLEALRSDDQRALAAALVNTEQALEKVAAEMTSKFASVNEFRGALSDQSKDMMTRNEARAELDSVRQEMSSEFRRINDKIEGLTKSKDEGTGKTIGFDKSWAIAIAIALVALAVIKFWK